jgi:hypothetical protein
MAIYEPLEQYLRTQATDRIPMSFAEVESIIRRKLPKSAFRHRPWWANEARGHSHAKAWLSAGYLTEHVDMKARKLVFVRAREPRGVAEEARMFASKSHSHEPKKSEGPHPLIGWMKGTFTIEPGWDLTKPALDPEELDAMEANLDRTGDLIERGLANKSR